jgi:D-sedoheptulose 7-phosphate isomerase
MDKFVKEYLNSLGKIIQDLEVKNISRVINAFKETHQKGKKIFVLGNGGSAATANHFACDLAKNVTKDEKNRFKIISLSENISCITAYGNDEGFETIFEEQLKNLIDDEDLTILISASGNSPNIIRAAEYAKKNNNTVIGITGFEGGKLKEICDINVNVLSDSYEKIEDIHLIITHIIVYWFKMNKNEIA